MLSQQKNLVFIQVSKRSCNNSKSQDEIPNRQKEATQLIPGCQQVEKSPGEHTTIIMTSAQLKNPFIVDILQYLIKAKNHKGS